MALSDYLPDALKGRDDVTAALDAVLGWLPDEVRNSPTIQRMFAEMLTPDGTAKGAADTARTSETERQQKLTEGRAKISQLFDAWGTSAADKARADYQAAYMPEVERAYREGRKGAIYDQARTGTLQSSASVQRLSDMMGDYNKQRIEVANGALGAGDAMRRTADALKGQAYSALDQGVSPFAAAQTGMANLYAYTQPQRFSPLAAMFEDVLTNTGNAMRARQQGYGSPFSSFFPSTGTPAQPQQPAPMAASFSGGALGVRKVQPTTNRKPGIAPISGGPVNARRVF